MGIGRYLSTDSADRIGQFGRAVADMTGDVLDWQTMVARRADNERRRRIEESREERLRKAADNTERGRDFDVMSELADMPQERRDLVAGTLSPERRRRFGFADALAPERFEVQPPTAVPPGSNLSPTTIETPGAPAFDPFAGLPADESITYRQSTFPTRDEYLDFRTDEERARYAGRPDRLSGPSGRQTVDRVAVRNVLDAAAKDAIGGMAITPGDYASIMSRALSGELALDDIPAEVDAARDRAPEADPDLGAGPVLGDDEPDDDDGGSFFDFLPWVGDDEEEEPPPAGGRLNGPRRAAAPPADAAPADSIPYFIRQAAEAGNDTDAIARAVAEARGIGEAEARRQVATVLGDSPPPTDDEVEAVRGSIREALDEGIAESEIAEVLADDLQITEAQARALIRAAREED